MNVLIQARRFVTSLTNRLQRFWQRRWLSLAVVVTCAFVWGCSSSVAGAQVDAKFKEQVLQVIRENPQAILDSVREYQAKQEQAKSAAQQSFLKAMKDDRKSAIGQSPTQGAANGRILLIEFSDFQCPYCAKAHEVLKQLVAQNSNQLTFAYKHFPLSQIHPEALPAAKAAWAAGQQGKFWEYHDALFAQQKQLGEALYSQIAKDLKLDQNKFDRDRNSQAASAAIAADTKLGEQLGVDGTPFLLVSGEKFSGPVQLQDLEALLGQSK